MARKKSTTSAPESDHLTETPPTRKAHIGLTETGLKDFLEQMQDIDTAMARVRQKGSDLKKRVEKDGGDWKSFKATYAATQLSENEARERLDNLVKYHALINIRVSWEENGQGTLDEVLEEAVEKSVTKARDGSERDFEEARAESDGYNSGRTKGTVDDNPFPPGSARHVAWIKGLNKYLEDTSTVVAA